MAQEKDNPEDEPKEEKRPNEGAPRGEAPVDDGCGK